MLFVNQKKKKKYSVQSLLCEVSRPTIDIQNCHDCHQMSATTACKTYTLVMVRHGRTHCTTANIFCSWFDDELSNEGKQSAIQVAHTLKKFNYTFDIAYTSLLKRAVHTMEIILKEINLPHVPIIKSWQLNERHYGDLIGKNRAETAEKYGQKQAQIWRRSYDVPPPPIQPDNPYYNGIINDPKYAHDPKPENIPKSESLKMTIERILPFWNANIVPQIKSGKRVILCGHGNTLRGIVKHLDNISEEDIVKLNIPNAIPFVYTLNERMEPIPGGSMQFLGDPAQVEQAMKEVADQLTRKH